jgi:glycerol kinase
MEKVLVGKKIISIDQSTTSSKAMIINPEGDILFSSSKKHTQIYPKSGWVEHDPLEIYENVQSVLKDVILKSGLESKEFKVISITNQRETVLVWDKDGKPIYNAIVWQCRRTSEICQNLKDSGLESFIKEKTGLVLDPYFSSTKIRWILDHVEGAQKKAEEGELFAGTIDSWLIYKLTGGSSHYTDFTNASRTMLFNIKNLKWDEELLKILNIPKKMLAEVKPSDSVFGYVKKGELLDIEIPISGVIGDSQGALFGQNCFEDGMVKTTYGTGSSVLLFTGDRFFESEKGLVTSIAWGIGSKIHYAIEGIIISSGDTLNWLKDNLCIVRDFKEIDKLAATINENEGVYLVPAFAGLGIPYWDMNARAAIVGMSKKTTRAHIARAAIESIAYQIKDAIDLMVSETNIKPKQLRADGGLTNSSIFMQFQADMLNIDVTNTEIEDLSLMGSAYLAGLGCGIWKNLDDIKNLRKKEKIFSPNMEEGSRKKYFYGWKESVKKVLTA